MILAVFLIVALLDMKFLMSLQLSTLKGTGNKISKLRKEVATLRQEIVAMKKMPLEKQGENIKVKQFISEGDVPSLLQDISDMANKNKVSIAQIKPLEGIKIKDDKLEGATSMVPVMIALDTVADYHSLGAFINTLENADKFIAVEEIKISGDAVNYFQQKASILLKTYVKK